MDEVCVKGERFYGVICGLKYSILYVFLSVIMMI